MSGESVTYLDSSALVKLAVDEPESITLREHLADGPFVVSSALARLELARAVMRHGPAATHTAGQIISQLDLLPLDDAILDAAADLQGPALRSLDAIHVASALALGDDLAEVVTYDRRMADAATALGLRVTTPA